jgi:nucleoside-diphosphate-sugar epimerase
LGATGHIAKGIIHGFKEMENSELILFSRSSSRLMDFLECIQFRRPAIKEYEEFYRGQYDVIINCIGIGDPQKLREFGPGIFYLTETFDNMVLQFLADHRGTLYINFSSGAAYGKEFDEPANDRTLTRLSINHIIDEDYYGIAKIHAEAKHRAHKNMGIVDLRLFGYFSRFIDLNTKYFMNEVIHCLRNQKEFVTGPTNIIRDYLNPRDLVSFINLCFDRDRLNGAFDLYSLKPVSKFEILDYFHQHFRLKYKIQEDFYYATATGAKMHYYSRNHKAQEIGYQPQYTSLETLVQETKEILNRSI